MPESRHGGPRNFAVEHFRPKKLFPRLKCDYSNLYYACNSCNDFKGARWPTRSQQACGYEFVDPCQSAISVHLGFDASTGAATPRTIAGRYTSDHLNLDRELLRVWRAGKQALECRLAEVSSLLDDLETEANILQLPLGLRLVDDLQRQLAQVKQRLETEYAVWW